MRKTIPSCLASGLLVMVAVGVSAAAQSAAHKADEEAIRQQSAEFARAFAKGDARAVAALWTEEGEYVEEDGDVVRGRSAIEKAFAAFFQQNPGSKIAVETTAIRFVSPDTVVEEGYLKLTPSGAELPTTTRYSVLRVRQEGQWKIALSRESETRGDHVADLAWLVGDWVARADDREIHIRYQWSASKTFLHGRFTATKDGKVVTAFHQVIGRDPSLGRLRSWMFEDDGGIGYGLWSRDGKAWQIQSSGVTADGSSYSAQNTLTRLGGG